MPGHRSARPQQDFGPKRKTPPNQIMPRCRRPRLKLRRGFKPCAPLPQLKWWLPLTQRTHGWPLI